MEYVLIGAAAAAAAVVVIASALIIKSKKNKLKYEEVSSDTKTTDTPVENTDNENAQEAFEEDEIVAEDEEQKETPQQESFPQQETPVQNQQQAQANIDGQLRFIIERNVIPAKLNDDPIYIITSIIADAGKYLNNFFNGLYAQQKSQSPYNEGDFTVSVPFDVAGAKAVKIDMPEKNLLPGLCKRIYIAYNERFTRILYITVELMPDGSLKMYSNIDQEREEYAIDEGNEETILSQIIADEEIAEEKYSDVLDKLMADVKDVKPNLLTDQQEIQKHAGIFMNALMQTQKFKQENKRDEALKLIREVIKKESVNYVNTPDAEFHSFHNSFELFLYANLYHPFNPEKKTKKQLVAMQVDLASAYLVFGAMMLEAKQYDKAIEIMAKAVEANPVNVQTLFALADAYKGKKYMNSFLAIIKRAHVCAYRKVDIARIYRNYAHYYTQIKEYDLAAALAYASKHFESNILPFNACMKEIETESGRTFSEPSVDELRNTLLSNGISWGAKELAPSVINMLNQQFTQAKNEAGMKMCADMLNELK